VPVIPIPSLPFFPSASLPELVWVTTALVAILASVHAWRRISEPSTRLKNAIRAVGSVPLLVTGIMAMLNPPQPTPTLLSLLTPMAIAFTCMGMALICVIDEQQADPATRATPLVDIERLRRALGQ
jgi:hypothetical protein